MRAAKIAILAALVIIVGAILFLAGSRAVALSYVSPLEKGEPGAVKQILDKGMGELLEKYHFRVIASAGVSLPAAPEQAETLHPLAERFFYVDSAGNVTIKGLSDENIPEDLSQKCILFADSGLSWFKARMLFDAFISEKIRTVYAAGLTASGKLAYTPFEVAAPGAFPMLYRHRICLLSDDKVYEYFEEDGSIVKFDSYAEFEKIAADIRDSSVSEKPFVRVLALDRVSFDAAFRTLAMFKPANLQAIVMVRTDDREYILAEVEELAARKNKPEEEK